MQELKEKHWRELRPRPQTKIVQKIEFNKSSIKLNQCFEPILKIFEFQKEKAPLQSGRVQQHAERFDELQYGDFPASDLPAESPKRRALAFEDLSEYLRPKTSRFLSWRFLIRSVYLKEILSEFVLSSSWELSCLNCPKINSGLRSSSRASYSSGCSRRRRAVSSRSWLAGWARRMSPRSGRISKDWTKPWRTESAPSSRISKTRRCSTRCRTTLNSWAFWLC